MFNRAIPVMLLAIFGLTKSKQHKLMSRFGVCYLLMFVSGLAVVLWHATLSRSYQIIYELTVVWSTLTYLYSIMAMDAQATGHAVLLGFHGVVTSVVYCFSSFKFFLFTRGCSLVLLVMWSGKVMRQIPKGDPVHPSCRSLYRCSSGVLLGSYALVLSEVALCESYPSLFRAFPSHAVFNLLDGVGQYLWICYATLAVYHWNHRQPKLQWGAGCLPYVIRDSHLRARGA